MSIPSCVYQIFLKEKIHSKEENSVFARIEWLTKKKRTLSSDKLC